MKQISTRRIAFFAARGLQSKAILPYDRTLCVDARNNVMAKLTITSRGQVTFRKEVLNHLGVHPGDKLQIDLLPGGKGLVKAATQTGRLSDFFGLLSDHSKKVATIEEMNQAIERSWAGKK